MNLILFAPAELGQPLPRQDRRAIHLLDVLRRRVGDSCDVGVIDGPRGKAKLAAIEADFLTLTFEWDAEPPLPDPIILIIGLPRPQTARKILQEATSLGVAAMHFVTTEKGETNYGLSTLWSSGEWRRHVTLGAEQAFCTHLPEVSHGRSLSEIFSVVSGAASRVALDNYESSTPLAKIPATNPPSVLAIGGERGWSAAERDALRSAGFTLAHLGPRVLRVETACIAALAVLKARLNG